MLPHANGRSRRCAEALQRLRRHAARSFALLAGLVLLANAIPRAAHAAEQAPSPSLSDAEVALFKTNHLKRVAQPAILHYAVKKSGSLEAGFEDSADVMVERGAKKGARKVEVKYLSGERNIEFPAIDSAEGNPVLLYFLERDIKEMERLTGGKAFHFRQRIRIALAEKAEVQPIKLSLNGKDVSARQIRIAPYLDDPLRERFEKYAGKYYVFTLSDQVPGVIYSIAATIPDGTSEAPAGKSPLMEEVLTFTNADAGGKKKP